MIHKEEASVVMRPRVMYLGDKESLSLKLEASSRGKTSCEEA